MIAFVLDRLGRDPAFLIGGEVPQLGGERRRGRGLARRRGRRVRPDVELLRPQIAVVTNVDLDHHSTFASRAEVEELFDALARRGAARRPRRRARAGRRCELARARRAQPPQRGRRARRAELAGVDRGEAVAGARRVPGRGPPARAARRGAAASRSTTTTRTIRPRSRRRSPPRASRRAGRVLVLFQPHLYSRTRHLARELARGARGRRRRSR